MPFLRRENISPSLNVRFQQGKSYNLNLIGFKNLQGLKLRIHYYTKDCFVAKAPRNDG